MTHELDGADLGSRTVGYTERDAILYALAVGAAASDLDLVFEQRLRVLPTFALTLAQWAPDVLAARGAWDVATALHGAQHLQVLAALPRDGEVRMSARVAAVWDKGTAAVFDVVVESEYFCATWSIFAPGRGGFGGERGPGAPAAPQGAPDRSTSLATADNQAALYRLTGDRHLIHIDPGAAAAIGAPRPILHGLCTLAAATLQVARATGAHPADLVELAGRFAAPVLPGQRLDLQLWSGADLRFAALHEGTPVLTAGHARFGG
ncbi:MAG: enoyl-CoA hydratase [Jatrophihabitans sp.]|nr:MAG: enoyl-CoA hydratase [Jatrophihabitans sp.]